MQEGAGGLSFLDSSYYWLLSGSRWAGNNRNILLRGRNCKQFFSAPAAFSSVAPHNIRFPVLRTDDFRHTIIPCNSMVDSSVMFAHCPDFHRRRHMHDTVIRPFADCLGDKLKNRAGRATERKKHGKAVELHGLVLFVPEK